VAVDTATGEQRPLAGRPVRESGWARAAHWLSEDEVLLALPGGGYQPDGESPPSDSVVLVRCRLSTGDCERATEAMTGVGLGRRLTFP
jgi:hypothetical protein